MFLVYKKIYIYISTYITHILLLILLLFSRSVVSNSFETPCTVAHLAVLSMGFHNQEY